MSIAETMKSTVSMSGDGSALCRKNAHPAVYFAVLAVLVTALFLITGGLVHAEDLLKAGDTAVTDTVGKDSSVIRWMMMLEVLAAIFGFIVTRNLKVMGGIVGISIFINICYAIIG